MRYLRALAAVTVLLSALAPGLAQAAGGSNGSGKVAPATFGAAPSGLKGADGRPYFSLNTTPGGQLLDRLVVTNYSTKPQTFLVYAVDAVPADDGSISFPLQTVKRLDAGSWISVNTGQADGTLKLKGRSAAIVPVRFLIPANASPGDHVAGVVVALNGRVTGGSFGSGGSQKITFQQRIAVKALFRVSGPLHPKLEILGLAAHYSGLLDPFARGRVRVTYSVHNAGNVVLGGPQGVTVTSLFGEKVTASLPDIPALLPGATFPVTVTVKGVYPELWMTARVRVAPSGLQGQITPGLRVVTAAVHFWVFPWLILLVVVLLVLGVLFLIWRRRRRRTEGKEAPQGRHRGTASRRGAAV